VNVLKKKNTCLGARNIFVFSNGLSAFVDLAGGIFIYLIFLFFYKITKIPLRIKE